ncbi:glycoside hydrolase family protein [Paraburkholderia sp. Ac-20342]|uniref:glycoside hydrolase family protein n=1 Tax=Paraburkholderia sp. Ac-20342 TaxID=2703889 RepID=UPI00197DCE58|nr:glycoside hydrolase family protein [Paraburkholderia sp. Ac-20342]MBN3848604.1 glycoside hydrolase family protein [Paraburkholderia sp. Ac-20342]
MNLALLEAELRRDEGVRYVPYLDTAKPPKHTVGVGHNLDVSPLPAGWTFPLTDAQVNQLLARDISTSVAKLDANLAWWRQLDEVRQRVVANMVFNMGIGNAALGTGLLGFKNALAAMQRGSYAIAAAAMLNSQWAKQVGARATRLANAMEHGVMPVVA